jgi:hypothetical protein
MTDSIEDLNGVIERFRCGEQEFYLDTRFGTEIPAEELNDAYKTEIVFDSKPVKSVNSILRLGKRLHCQVTLLDDSIEQCDVKYFDYDKSFVCREYDPRVVIPAILKDAEVAPFLIADDHPHFKDDYTADYGKTPDDTVSYEDDPDIYNMGVHSLASITAESQRERERSSRLRLFGMHNRFRNPFRQESEEVENEEPFKVTWEIPKIAERENNLLEIEIVISEEPVYPTKRPSNMEVRYKSKNKLLRNNNIYIDFPIAVNVKLVYHLLGKQTVKKYMMRISVV